MYDKDIDIIVRLTDNDECRHNFKMVLSSDENFHDLIDILIQMDLICLIDNWEIFNSK